MYSERAAREKEVGWYRTGSNIKHYRNCNEASKLCAMCWNLSTKDLASAFLLTLKTLFLCFLSMQRTTVLTPSPCLH